MNANLFEKEDYKNWTFEEITDLITEKVNSLNIDTYRISTDSEYYTTISRTLISEITNTTHANGNKYLHIKMTVFDKLHNLILIGFNDFEKANK